MWLLYVVCLQIYTFMHEEQQEYKNQQHIVFLIIPLVRKISSKNCFKCSISWSFDHQILVCVNRVLPIPRSVSEMPPILPKNAGIAKYVSLCTDPIPHKIETGTCYFPVSTTQNNPLDIIFSLPLYKPTQEVALCCLWQLLFVERRRRSWFHVSQMELATRQLFGNI